MNICETEHRDIVEVFDTHKRESLIWASSVRHNANCNINATLYATFKRNAKVNGVSKHIILSSHYLRIFGKPEDTKVELLIPIWQLHLLNQCPKGSLEFLCGENKYTISTTVEHHALILYAMFKYNSELVSLIHHKFSPKLFSRRRVSYQEIPLWMEITENYIFLYESAEVSSHKNGFRKRVFNFCFQVW